MSARELFIPRDVPFTPAYQDPDDEQRRWALGWDGNVPVFLTSFRDNPEWVVHYAVPDDDPRGRFGVTERRVTLWARMIHEFRGGT